MENVADALKMAGSVLLFVLALSVVIPLIGQARATADSVMAYSDRESEYLSSDLGDNYFFYSGNGNKSLRYVELDTIIPTIYRSYKENAKVIFKVGNDPLYLYKYHERNNSEKPFNSIDLKYTSIASELSKVFINGIVYGDFSYFDNLHSNNNSSKEEYESKFGVKLYTVNSEGGNSTVRIDDQGITPNNNCLYGYLSNHLEGGGKIRENIGVYYQEDISHYDNPDSVPEAQKDEKRVVTYTLE